MFLNHCLTADLRVETQTDQQIRTILRSDQQSVKAAVLPWSSVSLIRSVFQHHCFLSQAMVFAKYFQSFRNNFWDKIPNLTWELPDPSLLSTFYLLTTVNYKLALAIHLCKNEIMCCCSCWHSTSPERSSGWRPDMRDSAQEKLAKKVFSQLDIFRSWFYEPNSYISSYLEKH